MQQDLEFIVAATMLGLHEEGYLNLDLMDEEEIDDVIHTISQKICDDMEAEDVD